MRFELKRYWPRYYKERDELLMQEHPEGAYVRYEDAQQIIETMQGLLDEKTKALAEWRNRAEVLTAERLVQCHDACAEEMAATGQVEASDEKIEPAFMLRIRVLEEKVSMLEDLTRAERFSAAGQQVSREEVQSVAPNVFKEPIRVAHADLTREAESFFRSHCPVCKDGVLFGVRSHDTYQIQSHDVCISCGQRFEYMDVEDLRKKDPFKPLSIFNAPEKVNF